VKDQFGEAKTLLGHSEVRTYKDYPESFPLYPNEQLQEDVTPCPHIKENQAMKLIAKYPFIDHRYKVERAANDVYYFYGPGEYIPLVEEMMLGIQDNLINNRGEALLMEA